MTFFRSEEHLRNWARFDAEKAGGIISLPDLVKLFSGNMFRKRMESDYFSRRQEYIGELMADLPKLDNAGSFWQLPTS